MIAGMTAGEADHERLVLAREERIRVRFAPLGIAWPSSCRVLYRHNPVMTRRRRAGT